MPPADPSDPLDRYGRDVLAGDWKVPPRGRTTDVVAETGLVVEDAETGWCGAVVRLEKAGGVHVVHLEDRRGRTRGFPLGPGFLLDGAPVRLTAPRAAAAPVVARTASGSTAVQGLRARTARASRIWVEGRHDAEPGREGLGRRPAGRGRGRRAARRRRRPGRRGARLRPRPRAPAGRAGRPPRPRLEGVAAGGRGGGAAAVPAAPARRRPPLRRRLAVGAPRGARHRRLAAGAAAPGVEARRPGAPRVAARDADRRRARLAPHPRRGRHVRRPRTRACSAASRSLVDFVTADGDDR
nr:DUF3097 family protein [Angustibacter aerolatus]